MRKCGIVSNAIEATRIITRLQGQSVSRGIRHTRNPRCESQYRLDAISTSFEDVFAEVVRRCDWVYVVEVLRARAGV